jgi:hypothetical protein
VEVRSAALEGRIALLFDGAEEGVEVEVEDLARHNGGFSPQISQIIVYNKMGHALRRVERLLQPRRAQRNTEEREHSL